MPGVRVTSYTKRTVNIAVLPSSSRPNTHITNDTPLPPLQLGFTALEQLLPPRDGSLTDQKLFEGNHQLPVGQRIFLLGRGGLPSGEGGGTTRDLGGELFERRGLVGWEDVVVNVLFVPLRVHEVSRMHQEA